MARSVRKIEQAICFLVDTFRKSGHNSKPVIFHSLFVGFKLYELKQSEEVVIAGFLHDLIEDTDCQIKEIGKRFGKRISGLVQALTFDRSLKNYRTRTIDSLNKVLDFGKDASLIRLVDAYHNLPYIVKIKDPNLRADVLWKHELFIDKFRSYFNDEATYQKYILSYQELSNAPVA